MYDFDIFLYANSHRVWTRRQNVLKYLNKSNKDCSNVLQLISEECYKKFFEKTIENSNEFFESSIELKEYSNIIFERIVKESFDYSKKILKTQMMYGYSDISYKILTYKIETNHTQIDGVYNYTTTRIEDSINKTILGKLQKKDS
jgi:hypothetical protein